MKNKKFLIGLAILILIFNILIGLSNCVSGVECKDTLTYYFDSYDTGTTWNINPQYMVNGILALYAQTNINNDVELCDGNTAPSSHSGTIDYVYIRCYGYESANWGNIVLTPESVIGSGDDHTWNIQTSPQWSPWYDITNDTNMGAWTWLFLSNINCYVKFVQGVFPSTAYISKVELKVVYTWSEYDPYISDQYPHFSACLNPSRLIGFTANDDDNNNLWYNISLYYAKNNTLIHNWDGTTTDNSNVSVNISAYSQNNTMYKVYVNLTDNCGFTENITYFSTWCSYSCPDIDESKNDDGYVNFSLNYDSWVNISWESWFNDTNPDTLETILLLTDQYINNSGGCSGIVWVNYTDENLTFNVSVDKSDDSNTSTYSINDDVWLYLSGLSLEPELYIILLVSIWFYFAERSKDIILYLFTAITSLVGCAVFLAIDGLDYTSINCATGIILLFFGGYVLFIGIRNAKDMKDNE